MNRHKSMIIYYRTYKKIITVNTRNTCKMKFTDNLWLPFIGKPQSNVVLFVIFSFDKYKYIVTEWNHEIFIDDTVTFN